MPIIDIKEAMPGMVLSKNIENEENGITLITSGTVLNSRIIERISSIGIKYVHIFQKIEEDKELLIVEEEYELQETHKEFADKTKKLLHSIQLGKKPVITEISDVMDDLINQVTKSNNVLGKLRQLQKESDYLFEHSIKVSMLATMLAKWLNYSNKDLKLIGYAGVFHDIGKLKISHDILNKAGKLNSREFEIMKKHTVYGYNILQDTIGVSKSVALSALQHHEREDGSGYPLGFKSEKIHEFAQIIAICDIFNAMTTDKVYKSKQSPFKAAEYIARCSFNKLNPRIARVFLDNISKFYVGNVVKLNTGDIGEIILIHKNEPTRPVIKVGEGFVDLLIEKNIEIEEVIN
ncbi:HD domain-containing phosphohydrolase [Sporosalibacterium faouarense]|uniref:HD domain-containing phosphohydrolase n=1 Tax=Sporosalibacterium faouarense TaxID=516123 RepID=UPI00192C7E87